MNHESIALAEVGEDLFVSCSPCDYAANLEAAVAAPPPEASGEMEPLTEIHTPNCPAFRDVEELLGAPAERMLKTMVYEVDGHVALVLVPEDREVSEGELRRAFAPAEVRMLEDADFERHGLVKGYVGPPRAGLHHRGRHLPDGGRCRRAAPRRCRPGLAEGRRPLRGRGRRCQHGRRAGGGPWASGSIESSPEHGAEVVIDDREEWAGVKFADADLIGYPVQVVVGRRGIEAGKLDLKLRVTGERSQAGPARTTDAAIGLLASAP